MRISSGGKRGEIASVVVVHDRQALTGDAASRDVMAQMDAVARVLSAEGVTCVHIGLDLPSLADFKSLLADLKPDVVVNLVESLDGSDRLQTVIPLLLEDWRAPFTGCGSAAMLLANDKPAAKARLAECGLPVPGCARLDSAGALCFLPDSGDDMLTDKVIVKAADAHASLHIDDASILAAPTPEELAERLRRDAARHGMAFFAERFIDGREFNLSLLENPDGGVDVLPAAEIRFDALPEGRPRIVGYAAKWDEASTEYQATPRSFDFPAGDAALVETLGDLAKQAWRALGLAGYARVDFRVDQAGRPFILEANANPCISPDAGLAAAVERAGYEFSWLVWRILATARRPCP